VDLDKVLEVKRSGGSFGDAFSRPHELHGEVSPKRGAAIDVQLEAEDQALLQLKQARKAESEPKDGDAFSRPHELHAEVSPKRGAAIDVQLEAEDQALLQLKQARKAESEPKEE